MLDFNIVPLHASCVVNNNKPILIFGNSGSGKTTLQLSLLCSGLSFFSDDIVFIDDELLLYNSGETIISCTQKTIELANNLFEENIQKKFINDQYKHVLRADKVFDVYQNNLQPYLLLFPQLSDIKDYDIQPINKKDSCSKLIQYSISQKFSINEKMKYFSALKNISSSSTSYVIHRGTQPNINKLIDICKEIINL